ncbi:P-loop containing nucleoside triphosphate hydrolase protein [Suillus clintonianus]|uniref:P-loop containing nucleoside triphosphate hydrolase protein n=1 Tax=Suillus clintonianus TaxID=1904413 RepID=UPI001B877150|nr:P-loop containing nucleoside triphosphate hydrolase protein [Suillus clintonianus]KAG2154843.1 P-loop containing nucleoside triphosphate hydrolase protein [Suillus clintonianus]
MPSSSKNRGSLRSRISGSSSQKDSSKRSTGRSKGKSKEQPSNSTLPVLDGPLRDVQFIEQEHRKNIGSRPDIKPVFVDNPKSPVANFASNHLDKQPAYESVEGIVSGTSQKITRATVTLDTTPPLLGIGDHRVRRDAERLAALSALYQLHDTGQLDKPKPSASSSSSVPHVIELSDGSVVDFERARNFMDYYCRRYGFGKPDIELEEQRQGRMKSTWEAVMTVGDKKIGMGSGATKKAAQIQCYLDVAQYLQQCDPDLWKTFVEASKTGKDLGLAPKVYFQISTQLEDEIRMLSRDIKKSTLYRNRPAIGSGLMGSNTLRSQPVPVPAPRPSYARRLPRNFFAQRSEELKERRKAYLTNPAMEKMRNTRAALPIYTRSEELVSHIRENDVTICMAATGSGKTTQIPQLLLDDYIDKGEGARCNLICTQPRRLAALSVADRVAKERGEVVGEGSIGYSVRFESKLPEEHGSVTFCTTGVLLKKLQSAMVEGGLPAARMDEVTHIVVDEVHERDVDTDLLLVVLKRLMDDRKARNIPLKIVLMSATIDPTLFQEYFPDERGEPAKVIEIPGRTFPVTKHFMEDFIPALRNHRALNWVFEDNLVSKYLAREEAYVRSCGRSMTVENSPVLSNVDEDLDLPSPLVAASISYVLQRSDSGHVLVFLPGWDEISAVQKILIGGSMDINFNDPSKYSIHLLHSTIPLAEQQVIFEPPPEGVRRIILATNIAETSITIPDVVYVVDAARIKEQRYDPDRHMSSLISAWVGSSNLNQRAGRAGRHRSGEYFGILSKARAANLHPHPTVEMKRVDLSNVVMHVKALSFPGMDIEEVLAAAIEPPEPDRVAAAMKNLQMVGALDQGKNLTSLGKVLLQLPVEVQMGRLVLYGSFFRCLDQALTLAAILTNRDPFFSPMHLKAQAADAKNRWTPPGFRSDPLTILNAYNAWHEMQRRGEYMSANRFCNDNFLSKPTLLLITKIRGHLMQSLYQAGVIDVSAGGNVAPNDLRSRELTVPSDLNVNGKSLPLLAALIAIASQPKYAIRTGEMTYRTQLDKATFIHPGSVNHRRHAVVNDQAMEKQLYAFAEKRRNMSMVGSSPQTYLITTTRLDPMTYMLFGAYEIQVTERGLECDGWLPIAGNFNVLDDIQSLKTAMESCMLRVFEGIVMARRKRRQPTSQISVGEESESEDEDTLNKDFTLSTTEIKELDFMTTDIVRILNRYSDERIAYQPQSSSRTATPMTSPSTRFPFEPRSGYSSPYGAGSSYNSRSGTPNHRLSSSRRF